MSSDTSMLEKPRGELFSTYFGFSFSSLGKLQQPAQQFYFRLQREQSGANLSVLTSARAAWLA